MVEGEEVSKRGRAAPSPQPSALSLVSELIPKAPLRGRMKSYQHPAGLLAGAVVGDWEWGTLGS